MLLVPLLTLLCSAHGADSLTLVFVCRLKDEVPKMEAIILPNQTAAEIAAQVDLETKTVGELKDLDIWRYEVCSVTSLCYTSTLQNHAPVLSVSFEYSSIRFITPFQHTKFFCTAIILRLSPQQRWLFFFLQHVS